MKTFKEFISEAKEPTEGILKTKYGIYPAGEKLKILKFVKSGIYRVRFEDGKTDNIGKSAIEFKGSLKEAQQDDIILDLDGSGIQVRKTEKKVSGTTLHLKAPYNKFKIYVSGEITVYKNDEEVLWLPKGSDSDRLIDIIKKK